MKILVLGGSSFVGRHIVSEALNRGHSLTLFNRGETNPELFPKARRILGDREKDIERVAGERWDAVVDTCGYLPQVVELSCNTLADKTDLYVFVSTISVYQDFSARKIDESKPLASLADKASEDVKANYGPLKVLCENVVERSFAQRSLIVRPGIITGPYDPTDRFTYWVRTIADSECVLIPNQLGSPFQYVYAPDLARWLVSKLEERCSGIFNATTGFEELDWGQFLQTCVETLNPACRLVPVNDAFLAENEISDWSQLPLWIGESQKAFSGLYSIDSGRAVRAGLQHSELQKVLSETYSWVKEMGADYAPRVGLSQEKQKSLIQKALESK